MKQIVTKKWQVSAEQSGMKLLAFLKEGLPEYSLRFLKRALEKNGCEVNGRGERFASAVVGKGDVVTFVIDFAKEASAAFDPACILYENGDLLFYNKPPGLSSESSELLREMRKFAKEESIELLHRLDRDTTGILMFAKSPAVRSQVIGYFRRHQVKKTYYALVDGTPVKKTGIIDNYLGKKRIYEGQAIWGAVKPDEGVHAVTSWEVVKNGNGAALLRCFPKTGRTHQLRVHLSEMGCPILGDFQYGRRFHCSYKPLRYLLHAAEISFEHPQGNLLRVQAPLPNDFLNAMEKLQCTF